MTAALISVIIPVHRRLEYLAAAVSSVASQSDTDWEVIVVSDAATPDLTRLIGGVQGLTVIAGPGRGPGAARNRGAEVARGKWLVFLDDDDRLRPTALAALRRALLEHPEFVWAAGRLAYIDANGAVLGRVHPGRFETGDIYPAMIEGCQMGPPATVMVNREVFDRSGGFPPEQRFCEDYDLWLAMARDHPIAAVDEVVADYRVHATQATTDWRGLYDGHLRVLRKHRALARPGFTAAFDAAEANHLLALGDALYLAGDTREARQRWRDARRAGTLPRSTIAYRWIKSWVPSGLLRAARRTIRG